MDLIRHFICDVCLKVALLKLQPHLPGANELTLQTPSGSSIWGKCNHISNTSSHLFLSQNISQIVIRIYTWQSLFTCNNFEILNYLKILDIIVKWRINTGLEAIQTIMYNWAYYHFQKAKLKILSFQNITELGHEKFHSFLYDIQTWYIFNIIYLRNSVLMILYLVFI